MANINIKLIVDDKKLQEVLKKQYSVEVKPEAVQQRAFKTVQQQLTQAASAVQQRVGTTVGASALKSAIGAGVGTTAVQSLLSGGFTTEALLAGAGAYAGTRIGAVSAAKLFKKPTLSEIFNDYVKTLKEAESAPKLTGLQSVLKFFEEQQKATKKNWPAPARIPGFDSLFVDLPKIGQQLKNSLSSLASFSSSALSLAKTFGSRLRELVNFIAEGIQKAVASLSTAVSSKLSTALSLLGKHWLGIAGTISAIAAPALAASAYVIRQRQQAFSTALPTAEAISGLFSNVNESLFSRYPEIVEKMQSIARASGIAVEDLLKAVESSIPGLENQSPDILQKRAEIFAKLRKLEQLQPEQFAEIANVADIAGEDLARIGQMYNVLTDNVKTGTEQVLMQLRRLADDFGYDMPSLFATVEAVSKQLPDPRETTQVIREGLQDLKTYNDGLAKYYAEVDDLMKEGLTQQEALQIATPPEMLSERGQLLQTLFGSQYFAELYQKYAAIRPEDLSKSARALEKLPSQQLLDFFAQQREDI